MSTLDDATSIARVEFRRSVRTLGDETNKLVGIAISGLMIAGMALGVAAGLFFSGGWVLDAAAEHPFAVRGGFAGLWLGVAALTTFRTVSAVGAIDGQPGMLTTTSPRAVFGGLLLGEAARHLAYVGLPAAAVAAALSVGSGEPLAGPVLLVVGAVVWTIALPTGYLLGQCVRYLSRSVPVVRRNRLSLSLVALVVYMLVVLQFGELLLVAADTPVGWFGDLALWLALGAGNPVYAGVAAGGTVVGAPLAVAAAHRVSVANWYGDPAADGTDDGGASSGSLLQRLSRRLERVVGRPTAAVTRAVWLRARRSPFKLTFAIVPAFAFVGYLVPAVRDGHLPAGISVMVAGYAAWAVGAAFTLNPPGDEGALLPVTVASGISGASFVRGRMLAAWLPGVVPTATLSAILGLVVGNAPVIVLLTVAYAVVLTLAAPAFSAGIGMALPNFDTQQVMFGREAVVPSVVAFFVFLFVLGVVGAPGGIALMFFEAGDTVGGSLPLAAVGVAITAVLALAVSVPGYVYAVRKFQGHEVDR